jgi:hypothetical protein
VDTVFTHNNYIIKPQGLSIGGKFRVYDPQNTPVLFVEHKTKWSKPVTTYHVYADEKKQRELLLIQDADHPTLDEFCAVTDAVSGEKIGGINTDWDKWFEDSWSIYDAQGAVVGVLRETSTGRAILHDLTDGALPQNIQIMAGDQPLAELRQKSVLMGHHLLADFSMDVGSRLDRRLGLAAAIVVAVHQASTESV